MSAVKPDPLPALISDAWAKIVTGTYAKADLRIFEAGFRAGWQARGQEIKRAMKEAEDPKQRLTQ